MEVEEYQEFGLSIQAVLGSFRFSDRFTVMCIGLNELEYARTSSWNI